MSDSGQLHQRKSIFGKVPQELMHDLTITDGAVRLYAHMHWRYGQNRQFFEKLETIANWLGISERAVRDRILELEAGDWVVVISRRNPASHTARVNKYHVFDDQQEARDFRTAPFDIGELDSVRPKSEATTRKTRSGMGGIPSHKPKADGTQVPEDNRNSGSDGEGDINRNSGSKELEALKALNQTHTVATDVTTDSVPTSDSEYDAFLSKITTPATNQVKRPKGAMPNPKHADLLDVTPNANEAPPEFDMLVTVISDKLKLFGGGAAVMARMLMGKSGRGEYNTYRMDEPVTATELGDWAQWYERNNPRLNKPTTPMKLQSSILEYRAATTNAPAYTAPVIRDDDTLRRQAEERAAVYRRDTAQNGAF